MIYYEKVECTIYLMIVLGNCHISTKLIFFSLGSTILSSNGFRFASIVPYQLFCVLLYHFISSAKGFISKSNGIRQNTRGCPLSGTNEVKKWREYKLSSCIDWIVRVKTRCAFWPAEVKRVVDILACLFWPLISSSIGDFRNILRIRHTRPR